MGADRLTGIASYVPARVARQVAAELPPADGPRLDRFSGTLVFADVSGFTALTESLARRGDIGAEELTRCLNAYFGRLIDLIVGEGGDILKFAGDALIAAWYADAESVATTIRRAAQCSLAVQAQLNGFQAAADVTLSLRIGMSAGELALLHVGGVNGRRELVATGAPLTAMGAAIAEARPGDVTMSAEAWALVADDVVGEPLPGGAARVCGVRSPIAPRALEAPTVGNEHALLAYVPPAVAEHLRAGDSGWLAELRRVSVLFINFPGLTPATPLDRAHAVMVELQTVLARYEGTINKLSLDDKGASLVAAFGLPPLAHEDDAIRAGRAALAIRERLSLMQVLHSTGIATGMAFCGIVGSATRREYTMIGDVVNLSARLMQAAKGGILCDPATYDASRAAIRYDPTGSIHVKGKTGEIPVYSPVEAPGHEHEERGHFVEATVGRALELAAIDDALQALDARGAGAVLVFEGMAGIGKSHLLDETKRRARRAGLTILEARADAMEEATPFFIWRRVFDELFGLDPVAGAGERDAVVSARVAGLGHAGLAPLLPLANHVLRTSFPPTDATTAIPEQARAAFTFDLLADLLIAAGPERSHLLLVIEQAQWMDSPSIALATRIFAREAPLVAACALRPVRGPAFDEIQALASSPGARHFVLDALAGEQIVEIACRALGVSHLPPAAGTAIDARADGNPLLAQEVAAALRDTGLLRIVDGECRLSPGAGDLRSVDLPASIEGAVTARLDRLPSSQRLLLKVGSVVGRVFEWQVVLDLMRLQGDATAAGDDLRALETAGVIALERSHPEPAYIFRHLAFQEIIYRQMLFSQRRQLHQAIGELLEARHAGVQDPPYPRLALHWRKAVEGGDAAEATVRKAVEYLRKGAAQSLQQFANQEAVEFLTAALQQNARLPDTVERSRTELALCCLIGAPLLVTRGFAAPETERAYSRASELCQQLENSPEQFSAVYGVWSFALMKTQLARARALAAEAFRLAEASGDQELLLPAHRAVGDTAFWLGDLRVARAHLERAVALYRPEDHAREVFRSGQDQGVIAGALSAWVVWLLGYPDTAIARMEETLALARRLSHGHTMAMTFQNFTMAHQFRGETDAVLAKAATQLALSQEQGFPLWIAGATTMRGWARAQRGEPDEGIADLRRGITDWRATGAELAAPYYLGLLGETLGAAGRPEDGLEVILEALASSARSGEAWWRPELWRLEAELRLKLPMPDEAAVERLLLDALELAGSQESRSLQLRTAASLLRFRTEQGRPRDDAQRLLADSVRWFTEGHETSDLREAASLLSAAQPL